jgi:maleate isomerase
VTLLTPYPPHIDLLVAPYLARFGITVVHQVTLDIRDIHKVGEVTTEQLLALARSAPTAGTDAVAILATDLPTLDAVDSVAQLTGLPVVTANGAVLAAVQQRGADHLNPERLEPTP